MSKNASPANVYRKKPAMKVRKIPTLNPDGSEILDPTPLAVEMIGVRPLTMQELYEKFTQHGDVAHNLVYDDFLDDDDFMEELDDLPENGLSPYEVENPDLISIAKPGAIRKIRETLRNTKTAGKASKTAQEGPEAPTSTPPKEPGPERPHEAGVGPGDPPPKGGD